MKMILVASTIVLASAAYAADWKEEAIAEIRSEPKVVEAMFTGSSSLWVSVRDNGSRRDGLAESMCVLLHSAGMPTGDFYVVHVWDAAQMARGENVELGRFECSKKG